MERRSNTISRTFSGIIHLEATIVLQDLIGWEAALTGCWAKGWAAAQQDYYQSRRQQKTGKRWLTEVIKKFWQVSWDQWLHCNPKLHDKDQGIIAQTNQ